MFFCSALFRAAVSSIIEWVGIRKITFFSNIKNMLNREDRIDILHGYNSGAYRWLRNGVQRRK